MKNNRRKTIAGAALGLLAAVALTSTASAQLIVPAGTKELNFDVSGYASGATSANIADQAPGTAAGSGEDSWGIFQLTSVVATNGLSSNLFTDSGTDQYWGIYYGGTDLSVTAYGSNILEFIGTGLILDIYKVSGSSAAAFASVFNQGIEGRDINGNSVFEASEADEFLGISDVGTKVYSATTLGNYSSIVTFTGRGNLVTLALGNFEETFNDFYTGFDPEEIVFRFTGASTAAGASGGGWTAAFGGDVTFTPVPEPSTYGLIGAAALIGFVAVRRRFQKSAVKA